LPRLILPTFFGDFPRPTSFGGTIGCAGAKLFLCAKYPDGLRTDSTGFFASDGVKKGAFLLGERREGVFNMDMCLGEGAAAVGVPKSGHLPATANFLVGLGLSSGLMPSFIFWFSSTGADRFLGEDRAVGAAEKTGVGIFEGG